MNTNNLTKIYIVEPNGKLNIIDVPDQEHHYVGYVDYAKKQMLIDPKLSTLSKIVNIKVNASNGVLLASKIRNKLVESGYFALQTWYLVKEHLFYAKHTPIPENPAMIDNINKIFDILEFKKEDLFEYYHGNAIYKRELLLSKDSIENKNKEM